MDFKAPVPLLKFVGTVSLGLLTGVSYTVSSITVPSLLKLESSSSASHALADLTTSLKLPLLTLSSLGSVPFLVAYALSSRSSRHPYLFYTSFLAALSVIVPDLLVPPTIRQRPAAVAKKPAAPKPRALDASYEVLGDIKTEPAFAEEEEEQEEDEVVNGDHIKTEFDDTARNFLTRTGFAMAGFAIAVVGIWGERAPKA
jgi:autophagy-related protein 33